MTSAYGITTGEANEKERHMLQELRNKDFLKIGFLHHAGDNASRMGVGERTPEHIPLGNLLEQLEAVGFFCSNQSLRTFRGTGTIYIFTHQRLISFLRQKAWEDEFKRLTRQFWWKIDELNAREAEAYINLFFRSARSAPP